MTTIRFAPPYDLPHWPFTPPAELTEGRVIRHPVVIVGAGLAGLTMACDLAQRGIRAVVLDEDDTIGVRGASSRGICYAQKSLEIFERLGLYERIRDKGITWSVGRTFSGNDEVYRFDLQTSSVSRQPPFINLQQFYLEWFLVDRIHALGTTDLRWKNMVRQVTPQNDHVALTVETPQGDYTLEADWLIDASGANSGIRRQLGVAAQEALGSDRWCITDLRFKKPLPTERWTWTDAPFNEHRAVWQHLMGDGVWRIDYQMSPDSDPQEVSKPEVAAARLREQLGPDVDVEFVWIGPYQYRDLLLDEFRHGRIFFIGDAAHVVSPFGARGGNTGIQDAANLGWKLALVLTGRADQRLLDSYQAERRPAAVENLQVTGRTARFLAPRSSVEHRLRRAAIALARRHAFARTLVNTGRMSAANAYPPSAWLPDGARSLQNIAFDDTSIMQLLREGTRFLCLWVGTPPATVLALADRLPLTVRAIDADNPVARHLGAGAGTAIVIRPDAYLAAAIDAADATALQRLFKDIA